ncbi:MAG TPA: hypothetical protein VFP94_07140 [Terriglobales bacterium]|nr:hypothetical protein [Terriglobales bacterium]
MRYLLILMGAIVVALAVKMASENLWWIAIPDALFGAGVAWMATASLHAERHPHAVPVETSPAPAHEPQLAAARRRPEQSGRPLPGSEATALSDQRERPESGVEYPPAPPPAVVAVPPPIPPQPAPTEVRPVHHKKKRKHR